jgi:alpha-glucosidase (family GH31 glycosyl hydrolase)
MRREIMFLISLVFIPVLFASPPPEPSEVGLKILANEHWWGGAVVDGDLMPYDTTGFRYNQLADVKGNQAQPLLISSKGRFIWSESPLDFEFKDDSLIVKSSFADIELGQPGKTLREVFLYVSREFFPPSGDIPDPLLFTNPQYNTWIELQYNQNEKDVLNYARSILANGFPPGVLMIDDNWQIDYGNWDFSAERFKDPKGMVEKLHAMGFKVMLWVCPFISPDSETYRDLASRGILVYEDAQRSRPAIVRWWNGASAVLDLTNPDGEKWYLDQLYSLQKKYGIDGFKLDAGDPEFYKDIYACKNCLPNDHTEKHNQIGLKFPLNEFRAAWKMAGMPLAQRLRDKEHTWCDLSELIPDILAQGLLGYAFTCPDMIGGGEVNSFTDSAILDEELIVRSAQCHALMPMMQFSVAPWRVLNQENLTICRNMADLHKKMGEEILEITLKSGQTGEPIVRHLAYMYPDMGYENTKNQFMLGEKILVAPVVEKNRYSRSITFPPGKWKGEDGSVVKGPARVNVNAPIDRLPWYRNIDGE